MCLHLLKPFKSIVLKFSVYESYPYFVSILLSVLFFLWLLQLEFFLFSFLDCWLYSSTLVNLLLLVGLLYILSKFWHTYFIKKDSFTFSFPIWLPFISCSNLFLGKVFSSFLNRRRQWHPTPVLLPGKSHGRRSLVGCSPWGR